MKNSEITEDIKNSLSAASYGCMRLPRLNHLEDYELDFLFEVLAGLHECIPNNEPGRKHLRVNTWEICWRKIDLLDLQQYKNMLKTLYERFIPNGDSISNEDKVKELYLFIEDSNHAYEPCRVNGPIEWEGMKNYRTPLNDILRGWKIVEDCLDYANETFAF